MTDQHEKPVAPEAPDAKEPSGGLVRWLFNPGRRRFLLPATGAWILALDWLLFSSNAVSAWLATPVMVIAGFVLGGTGAYLFQRKGAKDAPWRAALKAIVAGIVVGIPWPVGGTLVGGWVLLSSGLGDAKNEIMRK